MFGFLKDKLKKAAQLFSKKVEEEGEEIKPVEEAVEQVEETKLIEKPQISKEEKKEKIVKAKLKKERVKKQDKKKPKEKKAVIEDVSDELSDSELEEIDSEELKEEKPEVEAREEEIKEFEEETFGKPEALHEDIKDVEPEKKGWFARLKEKVTEKVTTKKINSEQFEEFFYELEIALMENNVAGEVIEKIKDDLKEKIVDKPLRKGKIEEEIEESLANTIEDVLRESDFDLLDEIKNKKEKPYVILFFGVNGSGKTTTIAKLAYYLKQNGISCVLAAADTFRAASIEQLEEHANKLGLKVVKHKYGADPGAVAYDAVAHAKARRIDCVLVDTAGRQHSNQDLMTEMRKIARVAKADLKLFVGEAITGNDCVEQVREFNKAVEIDGIILSKLDIDEKGGAALSVSYVSGKPILFLGVGQKYGDLERFSKEKIIGGLGIK